ncbi:MAG: UDP binding domain-containing protein, partial [Xanthobacteraceae bacterium]
REAPSIAIVHSLLDKGANVRAYDPEGMAEARHVLPAEVVYAEDAYECAKNADALVIATEWDAFRALDFDRLKATLKRPIIIDLRNIYRPSEMEARGFLYDSVGRPQRVH